MTEIRFTVAGEAKPGGSKKGVVIPSSKPPRAVQSTSGHKPFTVAVADRNGQLVYGRQILSDANRDALKKWRKAVADAAQQRIIDLGADQGFGTEFELLKGPLDVQMIFYKPRPKSHYRSGRNAHLLKDSAPPAWIGMPDVLKLARAAEDALTGVLWGDDAQIVTERITKLYGAPARLEVAVREWQGADDVAPGQGALL